MSETKPESASRELVPYSPPSKSFADRMAALLGSSVAKAAILSLALAAGWAAGGGFSQADRSRVAAETDSRLLQLAAEVTELKAQLGGERQADRQAFVNVQAGIEELQRTTASSLLRFTGVVDRAEADRASDLARLNERIGRIEKQLADPTPVGSIPRTQLPQAAPAPAPCHTSVIETTRVPMTQAQPAKPAETAIRGYVLRGVADGVALVQTRTGLREIAPGDKLAGAGRVQSIEKRGRRWVVVTTEGIIDGDVFN